MTNQPDATLDTTEIGAVPHAMTSQEMFDDLGGFEEIAVATRFGTPVNDLAGTNATQFLRALIFADLRRKGSSDGNAYKAAQNLKLGQVKHYFREDTPNPGGDDESDESDESDAGKGA